MNTNSDEENEEKLEYERVFKFLDKNNRRRIGANDVIIGLGTLGKICSEKEKRKIENNSNYYNLESFINLCEEMIDFNDIENNLMLFLYSYESKEKPGYIDKQKISFIMKKYDFERHIKDKNINEIIKEVTKDNNENYVNIESLIKEFLIKY